MYTKWFTLLIISGLMTIANTKQVNPFRPMTCEKGWVQFERSCYLFVNRAVILKDAVIIWTGLTDIVKENDFVFISTGGKPTYTNWRKGEPNNVLKMEHCVEKWAGSGWNDGNCDVKFAFVCEINPM